MAKRASCRSNAASPTANARSVALSACCAPLLGGVLLGAALPAAGDVGIDPPMRLRLSESIENLSRPPVAPANGGGEPDLRELDPPGLNLPKLRLALVLLPPGGGGPVTPLPSAPLIAAVSPVPFRQEDLPKRERPLPAARPEEKSLPSESQKSVVSDATRASPGEHEAPTDGVSGISANVIGDGDFLPADEVDLPLPSSLPSRAAPSAPGAAMSGKKSRGWGVAPIRWGGTVSAGWRQRRSDSGGSYTNQIYDARVRGNSYIIQPYIATVMGDVGLTMVRDSNSGDSTAASSNLRGTGITGSGSVSVFPQSRFPFQATFSSSDSRSQGALTSSDTQQRRLSLRQSYRPPVAGWNTTAQYDRSELTGSFGRDTVDLLAGSFANSFDQHTLSANGSLTRNRSEEGSREDRALYFNYGNRVSDTLGIDSSATYTQQNYDIGGGESSSRGTMRSAQLFSFASWTPIESKWRGTANWRYYQVESAFGPSSFESRNLGAAASLGYQATRNLSVYGALHANAAVAGDARNTVASQNIGLNYSSDPYALGSYSYNWFGSGAFGNSTSSQVDPVRNASASVGHSLNRSWQIGESGFLSANAGQSVSSSRTMGLQTSSSSAITHNLSVSLQANATDRLSGYLSSSFSDSRTTGDTTSVFQMLNTQLSGRWRINALSDFNSNLTVQTYRQSSEGFDGESQRNKSQTQNTTIAGSLGYGHVRAFGVRGLRYSADYRANTGLGSSRSSGDVDAPRERITQDLDQRLFYRIGRLETELQARVAEVEGRREKLIYFKVSRNFGAF